MTGRLAETVVVVAGAADAAEVARRLSAEGATVVLVGPGGEATGRLVAELESGPGRVAVFDTDAGVDTLAAFIAEQFGRTDDS